MVANVFCIIGVQHGGTICAFRHACRCSRPFPHQHTTYTDAPYSFLSSSCPAHNRCPAWWRYLRFPTSVSLQSSFPPPTSGKPCSSTWRAALKISAVLIGSSKLTIPFTSGASPQTGMITRNTRNSVQGLTSFLTSLHVPLSPPSPSTNSSHHCRLLQRYFRDISLPVLSRKYPCGGWQLRWRPYWARIMRSFRLVFMYNRFNLLFFIKLCF